MTSYTSKYQTVFYIILLSLVLILTAFIFQSLFVVLVLAGIVSILIHPVYSWILRFVKYRALSSFLTILSLVVIVGFPMYLLSNQIFIEAQGLYSKMVSVQDVARGVEQSVGQDSLGQDIAQDIHGEQTQIVYTDIITQKIEGFVTQFVPEFTLDTNKYLVTFSSWVTSRLGGAVSITFDLTLKIFLFLIALFYFLRDSAQFKQNIKLINPFPEDKEKKIENAVVSSVRSVMIGAVVVALVQGALSMIGFKIFGVPNPVLWGTVAGLAALVPGIGTGIVTAPIVVFLFFYGGGFAWVGLLIWSALFVGLVDNFINPYIINKGVNIHPLLILFSIIGGLQFFGAEGFILGPLVLSVLFALMKLYEEDRKEA
jgi:predicted PurR-regulated permease PerM